MKKKQLPSKRDIVPASTESGPKPRSVFSDEFKRAAVARLRSGEKNATDLAVELGIRRPQLYEWAKKFDEQAPGETFRSPGRPVIGELGENEQLRRELAQTKEELAILKKFNAYLTRLKK